MQKKNNFTFASEEQKTKYLNDIIGFFRDERNEEIGIIAAQDFLDFFLDTVGKEVYKKGVTDSKKILQEGVADIELELDVLSAD